MDERFLVHNQHLVDAASFRDRDPHLVRLGKLPLVYRSPLLDQLPRDAPGVYTLCGGRQVGKTTLLKQWMAELLAEGLAPTRLCFLTGELIDDHHTLVRLVVDALASMPARGTRYLVLDEVTYVREWDRGIKFLWDAGHLDRTEVVISGSDAAVIREARVRLPGRRGDASTVDFHLQPLSFHAAVGLARRVDSLDEADPATVGLLFDEFHSYLAHGGYLTAMNDMVREGCIRPATLATYSDWVRGDVLKRGRHEHYLREVLGAVTRRGASQVTWNALAKDLSIDHHKTVLDYVALLEELDVLFVQAALVEDRLAGAPKKARKLHFTDPFIHHALACWLDPTSSPWSERILPTLDAPEPASRLVEACVAAHYRRRYPTFYLKAEGEVDVAYVDQGRFWPVEVKWSERSRPKDFKQVAKYRNSLILTRAREAGTVAGVPSLPVPVALYRLG